MLLKDHQVAEDARAWEQEGVREVRAAKWAKVLDGLRQRLSAQETMNSSLSAPWKVALALPMKEATDASNGWLAERLQMGSAAYLSKHVGLARRQKGKG